MPVHAPHDQGAQDPGETARSIVTGRPLRIVAPAACVTAALVQEQAVDPALEIRARADYIDGSCAAIEARTTSPTVLAELARIRDHVDAIRAHSEQAAGFLGACQDRLRVAEKSRDYDAVANLRIYDGREIARYLRPVLTTIGRDEGTAPVAAARAYLGGWFEQLGEDIFARRVELYDRHRRILRAEFVQWQSGRTA